MIVKKDHLTPHKNKRTTSTSVALDSRSFLAIPSVLVDGGLVVSPSDLDTLFPLLCSRIDMLHVSSEKLRTGLVDCQKQITDTF